MLETEYEIKYNKYRLRALREEYDDDEALNRDIAKKIETELEYPGQIKVNVIREFRGVEYAK